jgi:DNA-binding CsgD family transcriptional regulator
LPLTDKEKRVLNLLWAEKTNKEISDEMYLGIRSIEKIRKEMKDKLRIKTTIGLIKYALSHQILLSSLNGLLV